MHVRWKYCLNVEKWAWSDIWAMPVCQTIARSHIMLQTRSHIRKGYSSMNISRNNDFLPLQLWCTTIAPLPYNLKGPSDHRGERERSQYSPNPNNAPSFVFTLIALISSQDKKLSFFHCLSGKRNLLKWYITKCLVHYLCGIQTTCGRESPWVSLTKVTNFSWNMQERHSEELNRGRKNGD